VAANPAQSPATPISSPISTAQQAPSNLTAGHTAVAQPATSLPVAQAAPSAAAQPTVALDGYCPVQLIEGQRWTAGDRRFGAVHRGRLYFFAGPMEQQRFMRDPDHFSPMLAGYDAVVWQESGQLISGRREHGVFHDNRVFLFATEESLAKFERNPGAFTTPIEQAMRGGTGVRR
jgi:YHS domain-containing protein